MSPTLRAVAVLAVVVLTAASLVPRPEVKRFRTTRCQADRLQPARPPEGPMPSWAPPEVGIQRLWTGDGLVKGAAHDTATPILALGTEEVAAWTRSVFSGGEIAWRSPALTADLSEASVLRLVVVPGQATELKLTTSFKRKIDRRQRGLRTATFHLDGEAPDSPLVLDAPLAEIVGGNWDDEHFPDRRLRRLELRVDSEADAEGLELVGVEILGRDAEFAGRAAGRHTLEVDGLLRPGWFVRGGATVALDAEATSGLFTTSVAAIGAVSLTIEIGDERLELEPGAHWETHRLPTDGGQVRITAEGDGIALVGTPQVLPAEPVDAPNVVVLLIDTLRADHLGAWGSTTGASPHLDTLAREGASFGLAQSSASWTKPAIPTLMTGVWATTHQVGAHSYTDVLPPTVPTLQGQLARAGWRTGSFSASPLGSTLSGLERDFDLTAPPRHWAGRGGLLGHASLDKLTDAMLDWWDEGEGPVFAYLHAMEVHAWRRGPYQPEAGEPPPYEQALTDLDTKFGRLREALAERGVLDNTLIVVTSDHGESFGDHGVHDHGTSLYQSQIHVPLVFWAKELPSGWSTDPVGTADIAPTVLDLLGVEPLAEADGRSLVPAIARGKAVHDFVPSARERFVWRYLDEPIYAVTTAAGMKLIQQQGSESLFFDLDELCEGETSRWPPFFAQRQLDLWLDDQRRARKTFAERHPSPMHAVRADDVRMLEEMGYLDGAAH